MGVVVALSIVVILIAYSMYVGKKQVPAAEGQIRSSIQNLLYNKYYVDELYNAIIVKPLYWLSGIFDKVVEHLAIDKIINGLGSSVVAGSKVARLVQNGGIGYYVFIMIIGVVLLLALNVLK
jgi:NADH-quinone oxidoreductase subunit L